MKPKRIKASEHNFQHYTDPDPDRSEHIWFRQDCGAWKCLLCGAIAEGLPPPAPTPSNWYPIRYDEVTEEEKAMKPFELERDRK